MLAFKNIDAIICSFPKSGRTWLRQILGHYVINQFNLNEDPKAIFKWSKKYSNIPTVVSRHKLRLIDKILFFNTKIIFLIREPRDTVVSLYHWETNRGNLRSMNISNFIRDTRYGINRIIRHLNTTMIYADKKKFSHILTYEELHKNTKLTLNNLLNFLNININDVNISKAIQKASFSNMRSEELSGNYTLKKDQFNNENAFKTRKGRIGSYKNELSQEDVNFCNAEIKKNFIKN